MPIPSDSVSLNPPSSVVKIVGFLADVRARQTIGGKLDLNAAWDKHDISVNHIDGFLGWLGAGRVAGPPKEMELVRPPDRDLAKKPAETPVEEVAGRSAAESEGTEPAINIHLWNSLFRGEHRRGRRGTTPSQTPATANRAATFASGYNGNYMLASLATPNEAQAPIYRDFVGPEIAFQEDVRGKEALPEGTPLLPPTVLKNGLAAQAFGHRIADRAEGISPQWNEPLRQNLLPTFSAPDLKFRDLPDSGNAETSQEVSDPLYGQITLIAPPLTVSPELGQGAAMGLKFDWRDMAKGAGLVDYSGMATLAKTLPEGSQVLYPAIDPRKLRGSAVNLKLEPRFAVDLAAAGYGNQAKVDGRKSARMAADWYGGTPPVRLLPATMAPLPRPGRRRSGLSPDSLPQGGSGVPAEDPNRRMRFLDFLGLPIYLSPQLNTSPDLEQESRARISTEFSPRSPILTPMAFANLRSSLLGGFYGVEARPELGVWRRAMPDYERAGSAISGILSNRLRSGALGDGITRAAAPIARTVGASPMLGGMGGALGRSAGFALTGAALAERTPLRASPIAPATLSTPPGPISPATEAPRFIRHQPMGPIGDSGQRRPIAPTMPQTATSPRRQGTTAPQPASQGTTRISPQFNVTAERTPPPAKSLPAKQSMPSTPPAPQSAPMEGAKPARGSMAPQATSPRPVTPQIAQRIKPSPARAAEPMSGDAPKSGSGLKPPSMLVAPAKAVPALKADPEGVAIQASTSTPTGGSAESAATRGAEVAEKKEQGLPGSEVNLLANEVWILLKRRLAFEAQRMGR